MSKRTRLRDQALDLLAAPAAGKKQVDARAERHDPIAILSGPQAFSKSSLSRNARIAFDAFQRDAGAEPFRHHPA